MSSSSDTIVLVGEAEATSRSLTEQIVVALIDRGWNAHLVYEAGVGRESAWKSFSAQLRRGWDMHAPADGEENGQLYVSDPRLRGRVHHGDVEAALAALTPRVVHFQAGRCAAGLIGIARAMGARVIVSISGRDLAGDGLAVCDGADALHLSEAGVWPAVLRRGCSPDLRRAVIPPVVEDSVVQSCASAAQRDVLRILTIGGLDWVHGHEYALHAVRLLLERGVACEYHIVGHGDYADALGFARYELGVDRVTEIFPSTSPETVKAQMEWADVYVCPAVIDGISPAVVQAQAMALPVVATRGESIERDVVEDGRTGLLVPRRDPSALADCLEQLARDPTLRRRLGTSARAVALERFTLPQYVARIDDLYRTTLNAA